MGNYDTLSEGLYHPSFEKDACGIGFVAHLKGKKSHDIINDALIMLENMEHRGGCGCEKNTGDGAGILIQIPHLFYKEEARKLNIDLPELGKYGTGLTFFPKYNVDKEKCREILYKVAKELKLTILGWRKLSVDNSLVGSLALSGEPDIEQIFIIPNYCVEDTDVLERKLFVFRNYVTHQIHQAVESSKDLFYFTSLSASTIIYKGQLTTWEVKPYFLDLQNELTESALALVHSRFSTNTFPKWKLAQPFRYMAHNGEINTIRGNVNWMRTKETLLESSLFTKEELELILPICDPDQSDSANLDNVVELLYLAGRSLPHALMMLIPEAWQDNDQMPDYKKAFYEYNDCLFEPWDGPASICFTDGKIVGATLDRNGLRPSRYVLTSDHKLVMSSEAGALPVDESKVLLKGRLQPGRMFIADLSEGRIVSDEEIKFKICNEYPYREWLTKNKITFEDLPASPKVENQLQANDLFEQQQAFGYTTEDIKVIITPMAQTAYEPLGSMGTDTPLAVLSDQSQNISNYFKQLFAQVTNPPIDPIRERLVMSTFTMLGGGTSVLETLPDSCKQISIRQPILTDADIAKLRYIKHPDFKVITISTLFPVTGKPGALERAIHRICKQAESALEDENNILILSDRGVDIDHAPIPSLMAVGAVHHHLINIGTRINCSLVVESGDIREVHHFATHIGFGASAIHPYLAFQTIYDLGKNTLKETGYSNEKLTENYIKAASNGLLKIFSKMGISTYQSYHGSQIFEILGLSNDVVDKCFSGTPSRIGGLSFDDIAKEVLIRHDNAFPNKKAVGTRLEVGGVYQWKRRGEAHLFNPDTIHLLQYSTRRGDYKLFKKFSEKINDQVDKAITLRSLFEFDFSKSSSIPIEEVEPIENIMKRFATGAMSFGSISYEAHTTLAIAMNRIGAKSNSGEGGEDPIRYKLAANGDNLRSAIKQVASGRFGVTSYYLANSDELQIKMAQGAKPGEGGQLPGDKVDDWIGRTRHSTPGVGLISPPPHHDIYSIEDLAQLIYDLKNANPKARINVKLVAEAGVGTIAAGVAKAKADVILVSGYDGGTGASPISSIKHAGIPWELGLAEAHQTLVKNNLRSRVTLQTDGQLRTGRDIAIATLLGAEEYGIATAALVVSGCIMMRKCHLNTCPVGVATQNPLLRERFTGDPQHIINFFTFVAEELREIMAQLGFRTINEMVGQTDFLKKRENIDHWKSKTIDLTNVLYKFPADETVGLYKQVQQEHDINTELNVNMILKAQPALESGKKVKEDFRIINTDRACGTTLSYLISSKYDGEGLPEDSIEYHLRGSAGQSFGAFGAAGLSLSLEGEANDYLGKGLSGAKLIVYPDQLSKIKANENIIIGNVALYGATSGFAYIKGMAGERFCVRNSGATAVVEGVGDHGCEYMTGGVAVILGKTGRNFAAGMSGGVAYAYDINNEFPVNVNREMVQLEALEPEDFESLHVLITQHFKYTQSEVAATILQNWGAAKMYFVKVMPTDYKRILAERKLQAIANTWSI
ncbi:MAG TPA: glutamate synthase large subunit [Chitinophagales bacterium]|nr:glutamate synthase large subunit [Chitinophagales bacterium]